MTRRCVRCRRECGPETASCPVCGGVTDARFDRELSYQQRESNFGAEDDAGRAGDPDEVVDGGEVSPAGRSIGGGR